MLELQLVTKFRSCKEVFKMIDPSCRNLLPILEFIPSSLDAKCFADLKTTITGDGIWRIALRKGDPFIQVYKLQDKYTTPSRFLSEEFVAWRELSLAQEVADMLSHE
jgi:hypothetical protein